MGGINDIARGIEVNVIYTNYINIIKELQNNSIQPIIQSTLFTTSKYSKKVATLNKKLKDYANTENIKFIDLNEELSKNGYLLKKYSIDGVHLNANGYNIWKKEIKAYIE